LELKIQKIQLIPEIKDTLFNSITISIALQKLTEDFAVQLIDTIQNNRGKISLYVQIVDDLSPNKVKLFSRQIRFDMNKTVYHLLKKARDEKTIDFQIA
jgi:DNA polymerase III subunit alpha